MIRFYLCLTQILLICFWIISSNRKRALPKKDFFYYIFINSWTLIFIFQVIFGPILSFPSNPIIQVIGLLTYSFGLITALISKITIAKNWGLPMQHDQKSQPELIVTGIYSISRNPVYLSEMIMVIGFELSLGSYFIFLIFPFYSLNRYKAKKEEVILTNIFGKKYHQYYKSTPRFI